MEYVKLYRAVDDIEKELLEKRKCLSTVKYVAKASDNINTFDYNVHRKHFFLSIYSALLMQEVKYYEQLHLYSFDVPVNLCINYLGAGKYDVNNETLFLLEFGVPLLEIVKYTKDYKANIPFFRSYREYNYKGDYNIRKLIKLNDKIKAQSEHLYCSLAEICELANSSFAQNIYNRSKDYDYKMNVSSTETYEYLEGKKLIRKL